jgi:cobalt-zinc-cadmium efflux system protein
MSHSHHHNHSSKNIRTAFFLNLFFTLFELFGGLYTNSVAIISDAIHDLGDSLSLGISWFMQVKSGQVAPKSFSYGYKRLSLLAALINCLVLIIGSVFVINEAISRFIEPEHSNANGMILFGFVGIAVNGYAAWKMSTGKTMNERVISWHLIEDVLGWVAILIVAIILKFKDIPFLDPALSLVITLFILWNVIKKLKETVSLFLQNTPQNLNVMEIENAILSIEHVDSIHHTHIWSLDGEKHVFTSHIKLKEIQNLEQLLSVKCDLKRVIQKYHFEHYTLETELVNEQCAL